MRTAPLGEWIGERLNLMEGPVRFLLPEGGVSMLDRPGAPFHDPEADEALFEAIEKTVRPATSAARGARARKHQRSGVFRSGGRGFPFHFAVGPQEGVSGDADMNIRASRVWRVI